MHRESEKAETPSDPNIVVLESEPSLKGRVAGALVLVALIAGLSWPLVFVLLGDGQSVAQPTTGTPPDPAITCQRFSLPGVLGSLVDLALPSWSRFCELLPVP